MKKQTVSILALLVTASCIFFSCTNTTSKGVGDLTFDSLQVNETAHLFGDTAKPACNIVTDFTFIQSAADEALKDSLNSYFLSLCFGDKYAALSPEEAMEQYTRKYIADYRTDLEPMYLKDEQEHAEQESMTAWYSYYEAIQSNVQLYTGNLLVYRYRYEEYTGGAHGIYMTSFLNIDLNTLMPLHLEDREALTDLLWNQLMADNQVTTHEELEEMGYMTVGNLEPTENFYLSDKGITFYYNVYDIAPYVMGPIEITLPYDMLTHLLSDNNQILTNF